MREEILTLTCGWDGGFGWIPRGWQNRAFFLDAVMRFNRIDDLEFKDMEKFQDLLAFLVLLLQGGARVIFSADVS